jgi:hypothetical protein
MNKGKLMGQSFIMEEHLWVSFGLFVDGLTVFEILQTREIVFELLFPWVIVVVAIMFGDVALTPYACY